MSRALLAVAARRGRGQSARRGQAVAVGEYVGQVNASDNDAFEVISTGVVDITSTYNRFGVEGTAEPTWVGLRFTNVTLAQGDLVPYAALRLVARSANSNAVTLRFYAEDADNAAAFTTATGNLSSRARTTATVDWAVPNWEVGQDNDDTVSPNLGPLIEEVVGRVGWAPGNAIVLLAQTSPAAVTLFTRRAWSFDGSATDAPRLSINTTEGSSPPGPSPTGDFGDGYDLFGLLGNESFNASSPTLKDGTAITGDMLTYHNAMVYWSQNPSAQRKLTDAFNATEASTKARRGQTTQDPVMRMFRMTGDLRWLDYLCAGYAVLASNMVIAWNNPRYADLTAASSYSACDGAGGPNYPWSPDKKVLSWQYLNYTYGTDLVRLEQAKFWGIVMEFTWALWLNRNKASPGGYNYNTLFTNTWKPIIEGFLNTWTGPSTPDCWRGNYRGVDSIGVSGVSNTGSSPRRQATGLYPAFVRNETHAGMNSILLNYYLGRLGQAGAITLANASDAVVSARELATAFRTIGHVACSNADHGASLLTTHTAPFTGASNIVQRSTYTTHMGNSYLTMWLTGAFRDIFTSADMFKVGSAWSWMHKDSPNLGVRYADLLRGVPACGLVNDGSATEGSASENSITGGVSLGIVFDPGGSKMTNTAIHLQTTFSNYTTPDRAFIPGAQFLRAALLAVGDVE